MRRWIAIAVVALLILLALPTLVLVLVHHAGHTEPSPVGTSKR